MTVPLSRKQIINKALYFIIIFIQGCYIRKLIQEIMKLKLLSFAFLCTSMFSLAQLNVGNVSMNFGKEVTAKKGTVVQIAGEIDGITYALATKKKMYYIETFDSASQDYLKSKQIELNKINKAKVTIEDLAVIEDKIYVFANYYDKKSNQHIFAAYEVNKNLTLGPVKTVMAVDAEKRSKRGQYFFESSYDGSKYLLMHVNINSRKEQLRYDINLIDKDLNVVHEDYSEHEFEDRKDLEFSLDDFEVNEHGDIFIVLSDSWRNKKKKTTETNLNVHAYYSSKNYERENINIDLKGKKVLNCNVINTLDGRLQLIGFYSDLRRNGKSEWRIEGIFDVALNTTDNTIVNEVFNKFTFDVKKKLIGERKAKKGKDLAPFYRNTHLIERDNGGVIVLSEWYIRSVGRTSGIGPLAFTPVTYQTNEIIVTALDANGNLEWSNVLPKEQLVSVTQMSLGLFSGGSNGSVSVGVGVMFPLAVLGEGPEYLSSIPLYENGKLTLLVNDDPKNIGITDIDDVRKVRNIKKMIPVLFTFDDATGKMERKDPTEFEKRQLVVRPGVTYKRGPGEYLIFATNKESKQLGELTID